MKIVLLSTLFLSVNVFAIDTTKCPNRISFKADVTKVYKNSRYSNTPGWKEAQAALSSVDSLESTFKLVAKTSSTCRYRDNDLGFAALSTAQFQDPEENSPTKTDLLTVNLRDGNSSFVSFIPVKAYGQQSLLLYSKPFSVKIKARLGSNNFDMGMISVTAE